MTLEIKPATEFNVTLRSRPMKSKNEAAPVVAAPAKECRRGTVNPESRRDYLRALRAAEMAAWEAADRSAPEAQGILRPQSQQLTGELSSALIRRDKMEVALYAVVATASSVALLANLGALSHFAAGWSQFSGLFERILS